MTQGKKKHINQRTPWGGGKRRGVEKGGGVENLTTDTPPKRGFRPPLVRYVFHPPQASVLCFSCTKIHARADQKLFWRGPKIFGRARSLVRFPPPIRLAPPHITAQININKFAGLSPDWVGAKKLFMCFFFFFFGSFLMGEEKHINKIPPKIPGQSHENFVYVFCSLCVFFRSLITIASNVST